MKRFRVTLAGEDDWTDVDADSAYRAGEVWAEANWARSEGETSYELDVVDPDGKLLAVTVDVDVDVSFRGFAVPHPAGPTL